MEPVFQLFEHEWRMGDRERAKEIAREYVVAHPELIPVLEPNTLASLVKMVEGYRDSGHDEERIIVDMWLLAKYDSQHVSGYMNVGGIMEAVEAALRGETR